MKKITLFGAFVAFFAFQVSAQQDISSLMDRFQQYKDSPGSITQYFTSEEIQQISDHIKANSAVNPAPQGRAGGATAFGWESQGLGYGSFDTVTPDPYTMIAAGSGSADFESSGAINPADNDLAIVMDNAGEVWEVDVASGNYVSLGNVGVADAVGLEYDVTSGTLYLATLTELYTLDPSGPTATLVGALGTGGGVAIALAIDGNGVGYTYDITDDTFYSVDLSTGAATAVGAIGFDASFGQGMFWDEASDQVFMACLNAGAGNLGELRTVDLATGATTVVGEWNPGNVSQVAWASVGNTILSVDTPLAEQISIFPNPATTRINIQAPASVEITGATLYDVLGKDTGATLINGSIEVSNLARGVYILNVNTKKGTLTQKVIKR